MQLFTSFVTLALGSVAVSAVSSRSGLKAREFGDRLSARQIGGGPPSDLSFAGPPGGGSQLGGPAFSGQQTTSVTTQTVVSSFTSLQSTFVSAQSYLSTCSGYADAVTYLQTIYQQKISSFDFSFQSCQCQGIAQNTQYVQVIQSTLSAFYQIVQVVQRRFASQITSFSSVTVLYQSWFTQTYNFASTYQITGTVFQSCPTDLLKTTGFAPPGILSSLVGAVGGAVSGVTKAVGGLLSSVL